MLNRLFKSSPIIDQNTQEWILDTFAWAIENFDINILKNDSRLVLPNNEFYPGKVSSVNEMADSIFEHTKQYAGMQKWPVDLYSSTPELAARIEQIQVGGIVRGESAEISLVDAQQPLVLGFNPKQVNQPQDLIASIAQALATILVVSNKSLPPGGKDYLPQAIDLVACFMGFGVIFANTAYQFKGGCGSCNNASLNRQSALAEPETLYILALYCVIKDESAATVKSHLKGYLRRDFMKAYKSIKQSLTATAHPALLAAM